MTPLSRIMLPRTLRSASRFWGGRRSTPSRSGGMTHLPVDGPGTASCRAGRGYNFLLLLRGRDDHHLDFRLDVVAEVQLDAIEGDLLDRSFHPHHLRIDHQVLGPQRAGDLGGADRAVEV